MVKHSSRHWARHSQGFEYHASCVHVTHNYLKGNEDMCFLILSCLVRPATQEINLGPKLC